jgi:hypothetical protein
MNWIDIRVRKPEEKDADSFGHVWTLLPEGSHFVQHWSVLAAGDSIAVASVDHPTHRAEHGFTRNARH